MPVLLGIALMFYLLSFFGVFGIIFGVIVVIYNFFIYSSVLDDNTYDEYE
jgi:hypothetical protein